MSDNEEAFLFFIFFCYNKYMIKKQMCEEYVS